MNTTKALLSFVGLLTLGVSPVLAQDDGTSSPKTPGAATPGSAAPTQEADTAAAPPAPAADAAAAPQPSAPTAVASDGEDSEAAEEAAAGEQIEKLGSDAYYLSDGDDELDARELNALGFQPPQGEAEVAADGSGDLQLSAEELEALGFGAPGEAAAVDTDLRIYGFTDFSTQIGLNDRDSSWWGVYLPYRQAFGVGNFNLYLSKNLSENFRAMGEVRFTYLPNGSPGEIGGSRTNTVALDYADRNRELRYGSIEIERVYLEWSIHRYLTVRIGQFLTPYGIWNVDHGTPAIVPVSRPFIVGAGLFPERQTGFELFGRLDLDAENELGYHLTLSNGRGPVDSYRDFDGNKAVGARLYWVNRALGKLKVGVSGYMGRNTDATYVTNFGVDKTTVDENIVTQSDSKALALDVQWQLDNLLLQGEWIAEQLDITDAGQVFTQGAAGGTFPPSTYSVGGYLLAGYRFDWFGVMPYGELQYIDQYAGTLRVNTVAYVLGVNIRPVESVVFKVEFNHALFPDGHFVSDEALKFVQAQVAWAF